MLAKGLKLRLEQVGLYVSTVSTGTAARWDMLTSRYDAVVLDLGLPGQSGLDLMKQISSRTNPPPFIVLTGADAGDCDLARSMGAARVLQKPCPSWLLTKTVLSSIGK